MTALRSITSFSRWLALGGILVIAVGATVYCREQIAMPKRPIAVYLIPRDNKSAKVHVGFWRKTVRTDLKIRAGESAVVPPGERVFAVYASGRVELIDGPRRIQITDTAPQAQDFLAQPWRSFFPQFSGLTLPLRAGTIVITSPFGMTRFLNPVISWDAKENLLYDVAIIDPTDPQAPPRMLRGVRPPVAVKSLQSLQGEHLPADRILEVLIKPFSEPEVSGSARFLTAPDASVAELPSAPAELLVEAIRALAAQPERTGDAWTALSRLPAAWRKSELAVRLRLKAASALGTNEGLNQAREDGRSISP